jgi:integrase
MDVVRLATASWLRGCRPRAVIPTACPGASESDCATADGINVRSKGHDLRNALVVSCVTTLLFDEYLPHPDSRVSEDVILPPPFLARKRRALRRDEISRSKSICAPIRIVESCKSCSHRALVNGAADRNPVGKVPAPRNQRVRYLDEAEEEPRLREQMTVADFELVEVAMNTGLRQGRQFALRWAHVDLGKGVIRIPKSKNRDPYVVPLNDTVKRIRRRRLRLLHSPWVFPNASGNNHLDAHNFVRRVFDPSVEKAGIEDFHWHDLRHTFGSRLAMLRGAAADDQRTYEPPHDQPNDALCAPVSWSPAGGGPAPQHLRKEGADRHQNRHQQRRRRWRGGLRC